MLEICVSGYQNLKEMKEKNDLFDYEKNAYISRCSTDLIVYSENDRDEKK